MAIIIRPPNRLIADKKRDTKGPRPISTVGGGRGGSLIAFTEGTDKAR